MNNQSVIPAVIYARYSSSGQREESIEGQLRECREYADRNGYRIVGEYTDKALTGRTDKRPDFQRMLRDSEKGIFKAVICWKMDRFARNRYDSAMYKYKLKKNGVKILYAKESIPEGPEGIILESVMEGYAEYYSENLSQNVKRGNYESALELKTIGVRLLGYRKSPDDKFELDPVTAPIVRRIFEEYASGISAKEICRRLNDEGYKTIRGGRFNKNSVGNVIKNEKYTGTYIFKDIRVENAIPAIVDKKLFDKCQAIREKHHRAAAADRDTHFILTGKIFCGHCGRPMTGDGGTSRTGRRYYYYTCNGKRQQKCEKKRARQEWIEKLVIDKLIELIHSDEFMNEVSDGCLEYQDKEKDTSELFGLETRKKENEKAIQNVMAAIEAGIITPTTKSRLTELEAEGARIERAIAYLKMSEQNDTTLTKEQVVCFFKSLRRTRELNDKYRDVLVDTFLHSVYLFDNDKMIVAINYTDSPCEVTLENIKSALNTRSFSELFVAPFFAVKITQNAQTSPLGVSVYAVGFCLSVLSDFS